MSDPAGGRSRVNVLGVGVDPINLRTALAAIDRWIERGERHYVCLAPVHNILACQDDPGLERVFNQSGLTTPDGMPLVWIARAHGYRQTNRVYGPDLLLAACEHGLSPGYSHYFYGGGPRVAHDLARALISRFPGLKVAGTAAPPLRPLSAREQQDEIDRINAASPDIVWVAIGSPRQEHWMADNVDQLNASILIGVGAAFDFLSGRKPWAPRWIQRSGFEWLFRLATEPRRLWRRYLRYPQFVVLYAAQVLGIRRFPMNSAGSSPHPAVGGAEAGHDGERGSAAGIDLDDLPSARVLGVKVLALTVESLHRLIASAIQADRKILLPNVNAHALNLAYEQPWLRQFFNQADAVFPDGSGALFAARFQGSGFRERITYADWMWQLAGLCSEQGFSLYLLGGREGVAAEAAQALSRANPELQVAGTHHGYFDKTRGAPENNAVLEEINRLRPDILLVGFGMPLQERWFKENWSDLHVRVGLTSGAAFDYVAGRLRRPPRLLTEHGLEWLGRLLIEPGRLWRRYLIGLPKFTWRALFHRPALDPDPAGNDQG
jgi:N-acetylglucosaminyldiphosphoundecaprenol N-acetyl-beta-D-mannosaminyltransferase